MENKKIWPKKDVMKLIARYKHYRELWDIKSIEYRNTRSRRKAEVKLAIEFNTTVAEITRKIRILRSQFFHEYKKMYEDENGSSSSSAYVTKWAFYRPLQFILVSRGDNGDPGALELDNVSNDDSSSQNNDSNSDVDNTGNTERKARSKKRRRSESSSDSSGEQSDNSNRVPNDEFQVFGNYVASELRSMHYEKNIKELKRLIQQHIIRWTEEDDKEYFST